ncbi:MAG: 1-aminocyclopropane-1-carboxylate deaminase/D-cysteine desulfhydrase [Bacillota bacterium]
MKLPSSISLANIPTPLQQFNFNNCRFLIKRDDFTGLELSGNKVRKLEYLLSDAVKKKANVIYTCGGEQSNHSRATAVAAKSMGFDVKLFLWGKDKAAAEGNLFVDKFLNSRIRFLDRKEFSDVNRIMNEEKLKEEKKGKRVYIVPEGGSSPVGIWGYIRFFDELKDQQNLSRVKGILTASGSGGTTAGLLVGAALNKLKMKIFAVNVLYGQKEIKERILSLAYQCIEDYKLPCKINEKDLEIMDGYSKEGYKNISTEKVKVIKSFANASGIIFDPAYTGKAFYAYNENFLKGKSKSDVIFVHTGGLLGVFNKRKEYLSV